MEQQQASAAAAVAVAVAAEISLPASAISDDHPQPATKKKLGKVKWFNSSKGYGFITPEEGSSSSEDVFVHQTAIHAQGFRSLQQGEEVEYVAEEGEDGRWRAVEVKGPKGAYVQGAARYGSRGGRGRPASVAPSATLPAAAPAPHFPRFGGVCYSCGLVGHMSRDCRSAFYPPPPPAGRGRGRGPLFPRSCYACGVIGHLQRDCPNFASS